MFIIRNGNAKIEEHSNLKAAQHAYWIIVAHEVKAGRDAETYTLHGGEAGEATEASLPSWAKAALNLPESS